MKRILFIALFSLIATFSFGQFANTQTIGSPTTLFKSKGGLASDSSFILLNNYADTTAANFSVSKNYMGSFIRVGSVIWVRGSSLGNTTPNRWYEFARVGSTGTVSSISQGFGILSTPNPITTTGTVTVDTLAMSTKANVQKVKDSTLGVLADSLRTYVKLQNGVLYRQTGKFWISGDTALIDGLALVGRLSASQASGIPAINGQNTSTGRAGSFTAATGVGAYITNRSATNPALYVLQDSTSSIARFVNNFDLGVMIDTSADITISNLRSSGAFTGKIQLPTISANRTYALPNASGTIALTSNVTDSSAALRASINTKLNISDTAAMLANRLKISDTLTMLAPYLRKSDTATMLAPFVQYSDTSNQMSGYLRKNFALLLQDTATAFSVRPLNNRFLDSISAIRTLANSKYTGGTVTSVATNNGTGITGGTITTTGTLAIDTATTISTKLNVLNQLNKYTGSTNIVTLGTITTGVWNGTAIANANLQNSSITINGNSVSLGGSTTVTANTPNSITFNNGGAGGASGSTFNGGSALTVSYNTLGALATADTAAMKATITLDRVLQAGNSTGRTFTAGGATLTGALSGTSGTFSGIMQAKEYVLNGSNGNSGRIIQQGDLLSTVATNYLIQASTGNGIGLLTNGGTTINMFLNASGRLLVNTTTDDGSSIIQAQGGITATGKIFAKGTGTTTGLTLSSTLLYEESDQSFNITIPGAFPTVGFKLATTTGAATFSSSVTANSLIKSGGTSSQFLMADGSTSNLIWNRSSALISTNTAGDSLKLNATNGNANYIRTTSNGTFQVRDSSNGIVHLSSNSSQSYVYGDFQSQAGSITANSFINRVASVSTTYTVGSEGTVFASGNNYTITLPSASGGNTGRIIIIKRTSGGFGTPNIIISGVTLDSSENGGSLQCGAAAIYQSNGTNWYCISYHAGGCN